MSDDLERDGARVIAAMKAHEGSDQRRMFPKSECRRICKEEGVLDDNEIDRIYDEHCVAGGISEDALRRIASIARRAAGGPSDLEMGLAPYP